MSGLYSTRLKIDKTQLTAAHRLRMEGGFATYTVEIYKSSNNGSASPDIKHGSFKPEGTSDQEWPVYLDNSDSVKVHWTVYIDKIQLWEGWVKKVFAKGNADWSIPNIKDFSATQSRPDKGSPNEVAKQFNRSVEGNFNINNISVVNGKTYTVDSKGTKRNDYIHGDAPSQEELTAARYNIAERANLMLFRSEPDWLHELRLKTLALKADGSDGSAAVQHFIDGSGTDFIYSNGTTLAQEMRKTTQTKDFIKGLENYLGKIIQKNGTLPSENVVLASDLRKENVKLPNYNWQSAVGFDENTSAIIIGGVQAAKVKYKVELGAEKQFIKVKITQITFFDCFGAGLDDALGGKAIAPGFASFVVLQHYSNASKPNKYVPYTSIVNIEVD